MNYGIIDHQSILELLYSEEQYLEMISYCDKQILLSSDNYLFYGAKGTAYQQLEQYETSVEFFSKAIEILPTYSKGFFNRAISHYYLDNNDLSKLDFEKALSLDETCEINTSYYLTKICFTLKFYDKAIEYANIYIKEYEDFSIYHTKAESFFYLNNWGNAIASFEVLISNKSEENIYIQESLFTQALCYTVIKEYDKAINNYSLIIENYNINLGFDISKILNFRASLYFINKQIENGLKDIESILLNQREFISDIERINTHFFEHKKDFVICNLNNGNPFQLIGFDTVKIKKMLQSNIFENEILVNYCTINKGGVIGVYILSFTNGEFYVGKTINFNARVKQHFIKNKDIQTVFFKSVKYELLTEIETQTIAVLEQNLIRIRNSKQIYFVNIFDEVNQMKWKNDLNFNYNSGIRFNNELVRLQFAKQFKKLYKFECYDRLTSFLATLIQKIIPNYHASEYNYWNITCLPNFLPKEKCISRININSVPIVSIYLTENYWCPRVFKISYKCS